LGELRSEGERLILIETRSLAASVRGDAATT
jgi:hypothetical protein